MVRCEGDMIRRVPIFGGDFESEGEAEETVDDGYYGPAIGNGERSVLNTCGVSGGSDYGVGRCGLWDNLRSLGRNSRAGRNLLARLLRSVRA